MVGGQVNLGDYVDVPTRFRLALDKWPELRVIEEPAKVIAIGDKTFISVTMTVYRDPSDPLPAVATCWELFPGRTPFNLNSEQQNASTSCLGRVLGLMLPFSKMASFEEVQNRQNDTPAAPARAPKIIVDMPNKEVWPVSKKQLQELSELGYGGAVPANWNEAKAIIARMSVK